MNNNVNNMGATVSSGPTNVQPVSPQPINTVNTTVPSQAIASQPVSSGTTMAAVNAVPTQPVNVTSVSNANTINKSVHKKSGISSNTYLIVGFFVGFALLAAGFLLVLLLTGTIGGRNRLNFTKVVNGDGFTHVAQRYYKFEGDVYTQVQNVDTFTFTSLTDEEYNVRFDKIINNESNGITEYGFGTQISREGNVVTITSYNPNFFGDTKDDVIESNTREGFTKVK